MNNFQIEKMYKKSIIIIFLFLLAGNIVIADDQMLTNELYLKKKNYIINAYKDSLKYIGFENITNYKSNKSIQILDYIFNIALEYEFINIDSTQKYAEMHKQISTNLVNTYFQAQSNYLLGNVYQTRSNNKLSLKYYLKGIELANQSTNNDKNKLLGKLHRSTSFSYRYLDSNVQYLLYTKKGLYYFKLNKDTLNLAQEFSNLAVALFMLKDYQNSLLNYNIALELFTKIKNKRGIATIYTNLGLLYSKLKDYNKSNNLYFKAIKQYEEIYKNYNKSRNSQDGGNLGLVQTLLAQNYFEQKEFKKAEELLNISMNFQREIKDSLEIIKNYIVFTKYYHGTNQISKASKILDTLKNINNVNNVAEFLTQIRLLEVENSIMRGDTQEFNRLTQKYDSFFDKEKIAIKLLYFELKLKYYEKIKNDKQILKYLKANALLSDSLEKLENLDDLKQLQVELKFQNELNNLKEKNFQSKLVITNKLINQKIFNYFLVVISILISIFYIYVVKNHKRIKKVNIVLNETKSELEEKNQNLVDSQSLIVAQLLELNQLNNQKDKFVNTLSHDIRSPLSGLILSISNIVDYFEKYNKEELKQKITKIQLHSIKIYNLFEDVLKNNSQNKINKNELNFEQVNLNELIQNNIDLFTENSKMKNIEIVFNFSNNYNVYIDRNLINSVLRNLISNSIKFTNNGGIILILTEINKGINNENFKSKVLVKVQDNGIGIEENKISEIFNIDSKNISNGTNGELSFGLGLKLSKENINLHECEIWCESIKDEGTTFFFTLPLMNENEIE